MKATTALLTLLAAAGPLASGRYILNRDNHHHHDSSTPTTIPTGTAVPWPTGLRPTGTGNGALRPTAGPGDGDGDGGGGGEGGAWMGWQRVRTRVSEPVYGRPGVPVAGA